MSEIPWEPPLAGTEQEHLLAALDRQRTTFRYKADDLGPDGLAHRIPSSTLTLGSLLKHLAAAEDYYVATKFFGEPMPGPWTSFGWDGSNDWEFTSAVDDKPEDLYALYDGAVARSRARTAEALAAGGLDQLSPREWPGGQAPNLRRLLFDLLEEYGRHTGHADLLREAFDGREGEDPPADWQPVSGRYRFS
jgi:hypothetical protein